MKKYFILLTILFLTASCSSETAGNDSTQLTQLEITLKTNTTWPYEATGVLEIVEAWGYEESKYPSGAVGNLLKNNDVTDEGVPITIGKGVVSRAQIDIDSGKRVKVWLEAPVTESGFTTHPISRIEAI